MLYTDNELNFTDAREFCISHKALICFGFRLYPVCMDKDGSNMVGMATCCIQMMKYTDAREFCISHEALLRFALDGTVCEQGWLGYGGNCYMMYTDDVLNIADARELYILHEA